MGEMREWAEKSHTKKNRCNERRTFHFVQQNIPGHGRYVRVDEKSRVDCAHSSKTIKIEKRFSILFTGRRMAKLSFLHNNKSTTLEHETFNGTFFYQKCQLISQSETFLDLNFHSNSLCVCCLWMMTQIALCQQSRQLRNSKMKSHFRTDIRQQRERAARGGGKNCQKMNVTFVWHANK